MLHRGGFIFGNASLIAAESCSCAGSISGLWKAPPVPLIGRACNALAAVANSHSLVISAFVPAHETPLGKRELAIWHTASGPPAALASAHRRSMVFRSRPATEHMACGFRSDAASMASARSLTSFNASSNSRTPAAHSAVYSPRLRPATACGRSTASRLDSLRTSIPASPATNMHGWQYFVWVSLSSGPLAHRSLMLHPKILSAFSSISATAGILIASFSMPTF
mmetsp:Transcript_55842/g.169977  ORF Transcript_55842/g.169977 Transcript_55842/m.169977 type:complete len:224 (-) Transcript_55842:775-1446(-)